MLDTFRELCPGREFAGRLEGVGVDRMEVQNGRAGEVLRWVKGGGLDGWVSDGSSWGVGLDFVRYGTYCSVRLSLAILHLDVDWKLNNIRNRVYRRFWCCLSHDGLPHLGLALSILT